MSGKKLAKRLKMDRSEIDKLRNKITQTPPPFLYPNQLPNLASPSLSIPASQPQPLSYFKILATHPLFTGKLLYLNLFLLAFTLRLLYLYFVKSNPILVVPILDAEYYLKWAKDILTGGPMTQKVFFTEPFYAYLLAFFLKLSNNYGPWLATGLQVITGSLLPLIVFKLANKVFNRYVAIASGFITAIYGPFIFYDTLLLKTSLETFFLTLLVLILVNLISSSRKIYYLATGSFLGLIASLKGNVTTLVPVFILFIFLFLPKNIKEKIVLSAFFFFGFLISISPMTIHNYVVGRDFVPTNYSSGMFLYGGSWWDFDGGILPPPFIRPSPDYEEIDDYKMAEAYVGRKLKPSEVASFWTGKALDDITRDPWRYIKLEGKKILLLITKNELSDNYDYSFYKKSVAILRVLPDFWPVATLALTGIIILLFFKKLRLPLLIHSSFPTPTPIPLFTFYF